MTPVGLVQSSQLGLLNLNVLTSSFREQMHVSMWELPWTSVQDFVYSCPRGARRVGEMVRHSFISARPLGRSTLEVALRVNEGFFPSFPSLSFLRFSHSYGYKHVVTFHFAVVLLAIFRILTIVPGRSAAMK